MTKTQRRMTRDIAWHAAQDAGQRHCNAAGRHAWNESDFNAAMDEFARLWPEGSDAEQGG
jgi:hypothetical protein